MEAAAVVEATVGADSVCVGGGVTALCACGGGGGALCVRGGGGGTALCALGARVRDDDALFFVLVRVEAIGCGGIPPETKGLGVVFVLRQRALKMTGLCGDMCKCMHRSSVCF